MKVPIEVSPCLVCMTKEVPEYIPLISLTKVVNKKMRSGYPQYRVKEKLLSEKGVKICICNLCKNRFCCQDEEKSICDFSCIPITGVLYYLYNI